MYSASYKMFFCDLYNKCKSETLEGFKINPEFNNVTGKLVLHSHCQKYMRWGKTVHVTETNQLYALKSAFSII